MNTGTFIAYLHLHFWPTKLLVRLARAGISNFFIVYQSGEKTELCKIKLDTQESL